jgi:UDP-glucose 4-epimerase
VEQAADRMRPEASEVMVLQSDPSLARELLGWEATTDLETGIGATIDWLRGRPAPPTDAAHVQL